MLIKKGDFPSKPLSQGLEVIITLILPPGNCHRQTLSVRAKIIEAEHEFESSDFQSTWYIYFKKQ